MFEATKWTMHEAKNDTNHEYVELAKFEPPSGIYLFNKFKLTLIYKLNTIDLNLDKNLDSTIAVLKRFEFSSALQRMSVITLKYGAENKFHCYAKGSPEMIQSLSEPDSIPGDYYDVLEKYTEDGLRVLALAYKELPKLTPSEVSEIKREEIECNLKVLGFLIMENKIK